MSEGREHLDHRRPSSRSISSRFRAANFSLLVGTWRYLPQMASIIAARERGRRLGRLLERLGRREDFAVVSGMNELYPSLSRITIGYAPPEQSAKSIGGRSGRAPCGGGLAQVADVARCDDVLLARRWCFDTKFGVGGDSAGSR